MGKTPAFSCHNGLALSMLHVEQISLTMRGFYIESEAVD